MFVLEALTLTFITTPLVTALYPPERRVLERVCDPEEQVREADVGRKPAPSEVAAQTLDKDEMLRRAAKLAAGHNYTEVIDFRDRLEQGIAGRRVVSRVVWWRGHGDILPDGDVLGAGPL